jgi:hypothetical protein
MTTTHEQVEVAGISTRDLGSDHRAVIFRLKVKGTDGVWYPWTNVTYNMGGRATERDVVGLIKIAEDLSPGRWFLGLQETGDQADTLQDVIGQFPAVSLIQGKAGLGRAKTAAIVPTESLVADGLVPMSPRTYVGKPGAGGIFTDHKYLLRVRQRSGRIVIRNATVHLISSVEGKTTVWRLLRRGIHAVQRKVVIRWGLRHPQTPTTVSGDWNVHLGGQLLRDVAAALRMHGVGSHGGRDKNKRAIDLLAHN